MGNQVRNCIRENQFIYIQTNNLLTFLARIHKIRVIASTVICSHFIKFVFTIGVRDKYSDGYFSRCLV